MLLSEAADELYGADPSGFVARRTSLVKDARTAKDRALATQVAALRRPTVAAWYVNLLARSGATELDALVDLGATMRQAQAELDVARVAALAPRRRELEQAALARLQQVLADRDVTPSPAAWAEVGATLTAAVADPAAAAAVRSGCLARALGYAGFGEVDLSDAVGAELEAWVDRRAAERAELGAADDGTSGAGGELAVTSVGPAAERVDRDAADRAELGASSDRPGSADGELAGWPAAARGERSAADDAGQRNGAVATASEGVARPSRGGGQATRGDRPEVPRAERTAEKAVRLHLVPDLPDDLAAQEASAQEALLAAQRALERVRAAQRLDSARSERDAVTARHRAVVEEREQAEREVSEISRMYEKAQERLRTASAAEAEAAAALGEAVAAWREAEDSAR